MRRRPDVPNGLTEFLIVEMLAWAKEEDVAEVSLNFCVFTEFISPERAVTLPRRFLRHALLAADGLFQLERLYVFNRKFFPEWRPRYLCVEKLPTCRSSASRTSTSSSCSCRPARARNAALSRGREFLLRRAPAVRTGGLLSGVGEALCCAGGGALRASPPA